MSRKSIRPIFMLWFQGWSSAPKIVRQCALSWQRMNPNHQVICLDCFSLQGWSRLADALPAFQSLKISRQHRADFVRLHLLRQYGGVWADATTCCVRPISQWLKYQDGDPFFVFHNEGADQSRPCSNWFIAAEPESELLDAWWSGCLDYWSGRIQTRDYFWQHHALRAQLDQSKHLASLFDSCKSLGNSAPHFFHRHGFGGALDAATREHVDQDQSPIYKLTWKKCGIAQFPKIKYLFHQVHAKGMKDG